MAWYYGEFSCGHEGRVNIIGPHKDREWKKERAFAKLCPDCYEKERKERIQRENEEAAKLTKEYELPELTGTEKQVAWANTIRMNMFKKISDLENELRESGKKFRFYHTTKEGKEIIISLGSLSDMADAGFASHTDAKFWIEHRDHVNYVMSVFYDEMKRRKEDEAIPAEVKEEMGREIESLTSRPENCVKSGVVEIKFTEKDIKLYYVKDYDFINIVKKHRYSWDGVWHRKINELTGDFSDRAGEIGNVLLASGYTVKFPDMISKEKAVSGTFVPECDRWIKRISDEQLGIWWSGQNDTLYKAARAIPGAKWKDGNMVVSVEFYKELQEFASTLNFQITKKATSVIENYKKSESGYSIDSVSVPDNTPVPDQELLRKALEHSGVIEDLKDDVE